MFAVTSPIYRVLTCLKHFVRCCHSLRLGLPPQRHHQLIPSCTRAPPLSTCFDSLRSETPTLFEATTPISPPSEFHLAPSCTDSIAASPATQLFLSCNHTQRFQDKQKSGIVRSSGRWVVTLSESVYFVIQCFMQFNHSSFNSVYIVGILLVWLKLALYIEIWLK